MVRSTRDVDLEAKARELLHALGAGRIAQSVRVEWNPRLKTAAGRADFREKSISLNLLLRDVRAGKRDGKLLDGLKPSSLTSANTEVRDEIDRTLRHELAHLLAQWRAGPRRIAPHGAEWRAACRDLGIADEVRCHNLAFPTKTYRARFVYRCLNCRQDFPRVRRVWRAVACLACCRKHNGDSFDPRFRLKLISRE